MITKRAFANGIRIDLRMYNAATALIQEGHTVTVLGTGEIGQRLENRTVIDGILVIRHQFFQRLYGLFIDVLKKLKPSGRQTQEAEKKPVRMGKVKSYLTHLALDLYYFLFWASVLKEAVRQKADVYHAHDLPALLPAYLAAKINSAWLVYDSVELWVGRSRLAPYLPLQKRLIAAFEKVLIRKVDLVVAANPGIAGDLATRYGIEQPLVVLNCNRYTEVKPSAEIRHLLAGNGEKKVAIYVGNVMHDRGLEPLVESTRYLNEVIVAIAGDGLFREYLEAMVKQAGLQNRVRFMGWVPQKDLLLYAASADVGVVPTQNTCPNNRHALENKIFEYLMAGLPIAVSDQPQRRQIVEKYGVGEVFDEKDPKSIAQAIDRILSDEERYREMRHRARQAAREEFNWKVQGKKLVEGYRKLFVSPLGRTDAGKIGKK
jgi:glycosyltransferase involved in cell wall biosynthesis